MTVELPAFHIMKKNNIQPIRAIDLDWSAPAENTALDGQILSDEIAVLTIWLAGKYAAADNALYGVLIDKPGLCEKICFSRGPRAGKKGGAEQVESLHDLTLKAIEQLRLAARSHLEQMAASRDGGSKQTPRLP
jgi:hypothetical protein